MDDIDDIADQMDTHGNVGTKAKVGSKRRLGKTVPISKKAQSHWRKQLRSYNLHKSKRNAHP